MKITIIAAAAAISLSVGSAYAWEGVGSATNTQFTHTPDVAVQAPEQARTAAR